MFHRARGIGLGDFTPVHGAANQKRERGIKGMRGSNHRPGVAGLADPLYPERSVTAHGYSPSLRPVPDAALSIIVASLISSSVSPPLSWVVSVTQTRL